VYEIWQRLLCVRKNEQGFTLSELLTTVAILAVLIATAFVIFLALLER